MENGERRVEGGQGRGEREAAEGAGGRRGERESAQGRGAREREMEATRGEEEFAGGRGRGGRVKAPTCAGESHVKTLEIVWIPRLEVFIPRDPEHPLPSPLLPHMLPRLLTRADKAREQRRVEAERGELLECKGAAAGGVGEDNEPLPRGCECREAVDRSWQRGGAIMKDSELVEE